jgi:hypothetical protein
MASCQKRFMAYQVIAEKIGEFLRVACTQGVFAKIIHPYFIASARIGRYEKI